MLTCYIVTHASLFTTAQITVVGSYTYTVCMYERYAFSILHTVCSIHPLSTHTPPLRIHVFSIFIFSNN